MKSSDKFYKLLQKFLSVFEALFLAVVKAYLNTQIGQGFLKKVVGYMVDKLYAETVDPLLEVLLVKIGYRHDVREGQVFVERLKKAQESGNATDYNSATDDIFR